MSAECYPIAVLPHTTQLYRDYLAMSEHDAVRTWYGGTPLGGEWMRSAPAGSADAAHRDRLAAALQAAQICSNPILIRVETRAGHGAGRVGVEPRAPIAHQEPANAKTRPGSSPGRSAPILGALPLRTGAFQ